MILNDIPEPGNGAKVKFLEAAMYEENKRLAERWFEEVWNRRRENAIDEFG
jgi:hypothetical protein